MVGGWLHPRATTRDPAPVTKPGLSPPLLPSPNFQPSLLLLFSLGAHIPPAYHCYLTDSVSAALLSEEIIADKTVSILFKAILNCTLSRGPFELCFSCIATSPEALFFFSSGVSAIQQGHRNQLAIHLEHLPGPLTEVLPFYLSSRCRFAS